jgi:hypothetical protein
MLRNTMRTYPGALHKMAAPIAVPAFAAHMLTKRKKAEDIRSTICPVLHAARGFLQAQPRNV